MAPTEDPRATPPPADPAEEAFWRDYLTNGAGFEQKMRGLHLRLPHDPRCQLCAAPFAGVGARVMRLAGRAPSRSSPNMCNKCFAFLESHRGGAEIECTLLFADIRGSTAMAEGMSSSAFHDRLEHFYEAASASVFEHGGIVDKFVGDEVVANFFPLLAGEDHAAKGVAAAQELLRATGHEDPAGPWIPVGAGVHTDIVWMGTVGDRGHVDITALGDGVNTAARLASAATQGEVLVTADAAAQAGLDLPDARRTIELKGKSAETEVVSLRMRPAVGVPD